MLAAFLLGCLILPGHSSRASVQAEELSTLQGKVLQQGSRGQSVLVLQRALSGLGYDTGPADGVFGPRTLEAVKRLQKESGIAVDGIVGALTLDRLERAWAAKFPPQTYVLREGETLSLVCARFGVSLEEIVRINGLKNPDLVYAGQTLLLTAPAEKDPGGAGREGTDGPQGGAPVESPGDSSPSNRSFPVPDKKICLTFDDGPDPITTPKILEILSAYGISGVFFVTGKNADRYPELVTEIYERGHSLGVHGYEHVPLAGLSRQAALSDLSKALETVERITGTRPSLWRPPGGSIDDLTREMTRELNLTLVMWTNICGADLGVSSPEEVVRRVLNYAHDGAIILLHEGNPCVAEALPRIIEELARRGFAFQTLR